MGRGRQQGRGAPAAAKEGGKGKEKQVAERKGKEMQKEPMEEVQVLGEERQEEEGQDSGVGKRFFKVFLPEQSQERLRIPSPFYKYLKQGNVGSASLKIMGGNTWQVALTYGSEGFYFTRGWKEFARDHRLSPGHFLVFTYDGHSQFSVVVFSPSGVEDPSSLVARPCDHTVVKIEDDVGDMNTDEGGTSEMTIVVQEEDNETRRKRLRGVGKVIAEGSTLKKPSNVLKETDKKMSEDIVATSKAILPVHASNKDSPARLLDERKYINKSRIRDKDLPRTGRIVRKRARQPVVLSQRRLITEEEKNLALKKANEFKSKNPFALQIMTESYVYVGFFMNIPCEFVRESLPRTNKKMTLWDPQEKPWEVSYVYYSDRRVGAFSGGWGKFAVGNNLEKFDVCVFELFKEDNIKVHIYRVVSEITPLRRSKNK